MKKEIIAYFKNNPGAGLKSKKLAHLLNITEDHSYASLKAQLHSLVEEGVLIRDGKRYLMFTPAANAAVIGTLKIAREGYGFVIPDSKKMTDIFIPERNLHSAMTGDRVEVAISKSQKQKAKNLEGEVVKIIKRKIEVLVGVLRKTKSGWSLVPERREITNKIVIGEDHLGGFTDGDRVIVGELTWEASISGFSGVVLKSAGAGMTLDDEYMTIYSEYGLNPNFPQSVLSEADGVKIVIDEKELQNREDFRKEIVVTIDPVDAKDFDDALSIKKMESGNYEIGIHIADVSHYVTPGSALDTEADKRGNSVYLCGKVVPMLPEVLSNGICSLKPNEDRLTYSCIVEMTPRGKLIDYHFAKTIINSKRRYTYAEVQEIIKSKKGDYAEQITTLNKIARILRNKRMTAGSINFKSVEVKIFLDEKNQPERIQQEHSDESHELVEEFMLMANKLTATFIKEKSLHKDETASIYRIHDKPDTEKLSNFINLLKTLDYKNLPAADKIKPQDLNTIIQTAEGKPEETLINGLAVRAMAKAVYSPHNIGHYGLGFKFYTHFTSPIRRYSDLLAHRVLLAVQKKERKLPYTYAQIEAICDRLTFTERNAMEAERATIKMKQVQFMKSFVGEEFEAVISGVTSFGIFVEVADYHSEGLIRMSDLDDDYYIFDEKKYSLIGKRHKRAYRLGDPVRVKLVRVDEVKQVLDFVLAAAASDDEPF